LKAYSLLDLAKSAEVPTAVVPLYADANLAYATVDCVVGNDPLADVTAPIVSITSPAAGFQVSGSVPVSAIASDATGVTSVTLNVDGVAKSTLTAEPYTFTWNSATVADGNHTLTLMARDAAGNAGQAAIAITVKNTFADSVPPTVKITSPVNGARITSTSTTVTVNATDNVKVTKVDLYVDGTLAASSTTSPFKLSWNTKKVSAGAHTLKCIARDAAGNSAISPVVSVTK
jgi:hypothetical protein